MRLGLLLFILICLGFTACRKSDEVTTDKNAKLSFSTDTVLFDTVFTSVGSVNKRFKVYNNNQKAINISNIKLSSGYTSYFNLIINGAAINEQSNIRIEASDSISIYIKAEINPNNQNQPFIVQDSILFNTNGNAQSVAIIAYGQNAIFINSQNISSTTNWTSTLPYVIYKNLTVNPNTTLRINPGTRVLFHGNAGMNILGTLKVEGTANDPVLFASDRLETIYMEEPGQWTGLHFHSSSHASSIQNAIIKNAIIGIRVDSLSIGLAPKLLLSNTLIKNMQLAALVGYQAKINAYNNLFYNCGQYLVYAIGGGQYDMKQNTFAGFNFNFARRTPAVYFSNGGTSTLNGNGMITGDLNVVLTNNIIWGVLTEELLIEKKTANSLVSVVNNNIIKTTLKSYDDDFNMLNIDPLFKNIQVGDFELATNSPALNKGAMLSNDTYKDILSKDIKHLKRFFPSELGCYEKN